MRPDFDMDFDGIFDLEGNEIKIETFKNSVASDVKNIFFNLDEFAENHSIGESKIPIVIDDDRMNELIGSKFTPLDMIYEKMILFYVDKELLDFIPKVNGQLFFDGDLYQIIDVADDGFGLLTITIGRNMGR